MSSKHNIKCHTKHFIGPSGEKIINYGRNNQLWPPKLTLLVVGGGGLGVLTIQYRQIQKCLTKSLKPLFKYSEKILVF